MWIFERCRGTGPRTKIQKFARKQWTPFRQTATRFVFPSPLSSFRTLAFSHPLSRTQKEVKEIYCIIYRLVVGADELNDSFPTFTTAQKGKKKKILIILYY